MSEAINPEQFLETAYPEYSSANIGAPTLRIHENETEHLSTVIPHEGPVPGTDLMLPYETDLPSYFKVSQTSGLRKEQGASITEIKTLSDTPAVLDTGLVALETEFNTKKSPWLSRTIGATVFGATAASWGFELSPANEAFRGNITFDVLKHIHGSPVENGLIAAAVVTAATVVIEMVPSTIVAYGINREGSLAHKYVQRKLAKQDAKAAERAARKAEASGELALPQGEVMDESQGGVKEKAIDFSIAMSVGSAAVVAKRHLKDREPSFKKDMKNARQAAKYVALGSGAVGFLAGGGIQVAADHGFQNQAKWVVDHGADWKTWAIAFGIIQGGTFIKNGIERMTDSIKNRAARNNRQQIAERVEI